MSDSCFQRTWSEDQIRELISQTIKEHEYDSFSFGLFDLTLAECCARWGVSSRNSVKARAAALGVKLRRESSTRTAWPAEHLPLGDELAEHLRKPGGTLANFRKPLTNVKPKEKLLYHTTRQIQDLIWSHKIELINLLGKEFRVPELQVVLRQFTKLHPGDEETLKDGLRWNETVYSAMQTISCIERAGRRGYYRFATTQEQPSLF